ncbi:MAG: beta-propeller domain-containing protein [bacterium]
MNHIKDGFKKDDYVFLLKVLSVFITTSCLFLCPVKSDAALFQTESNPYFTSFQFNSFPALSNQFDNFRINSYGLNNFNSTKSLLNFNTNYNWNGLSQNNGFFNLNNSFGLHNTTNRLVINSFNNLYNHFDLSIPGRSYSFNTVQFYNTGNFSFNSNAFTANPVNNLYNLNGSVQDLQRFNLLFLAPEQNKDNDSQVQNNREGQENTEDNFTRSLPGGSYLAKLKPVTNCGDLLAKLKEEAINKMEEEIDSYIKTVIECGGCCNDNKDYSRTALSNSDSSLVPYFYGTNGLILCPPLPYGLNMDLYPWSESADDYSTTNLQVAGVDEADFIKNDGSYIYILTDDRFLIIDAWPPQNANIISRMKIEGIPRKLFVANDRALIFSSLDYLDDRDYSFGSDSECTYGYNCDFTGDNRKLKITVFDISDRLNPKLVREIRFGGSYINSRRVGSAVYTVVFSPAYFAPYLEYRTEIYDWCELPPWDKDFYELYNEPPTMEELLAAFEELKEKNQKIIEDSTISDWLPSIRDIIYGPGGTITDDNLFYDCTSFYDTDKPDNKSFLTIVSMDIDSLEELSQQTIFAYPGAVYASSDALYISSIQKYESDQKWFFDKSSGIQEASTVHKFRLQSDPPGVEYAGSGVVKGKVLNQFSMDEYEGHLRIATTTWHVPSPYVHSTLSILEEKPDGLKVVGEIDDIAPKEDIRSVRFNGAKGFIVTFKKTDPLFGLDLSDPKKPMIAGELKIPGYSTYIHLLDDDHLLSIGYDSDDQGDFAWFQGIMLQLFDVSDMADLKLMHKEVIGTRGSTSEAATNHLAFNYFPPKNLLAIPMTICEGGSGGSYGTDMTFSGLMVYDVSLNDGFSERGRVSHMEPSYENWRSMCANWWTDSDSVVQRSIFMDDYVYSVAMDKIIINHLDYLGEDINILELQ